MNSIITTIVSPSPPLFDSKRFTKRRKFVILTINPGQRKILAKSIKSHEELYISLTFSMVFRNVLRYQHYFKLCHVAIFCATNFVTNFVLFFAYSHFSYHLGFLFLNFNKYYSVLKFFSIYWYIIISSFIIDLNTKECGKTFYFIL